jgi:hypothetical protein
MKKKKKTLWRSASFQKERIELIEQDLKKINKEAFLGFKQLYKKSKSKELRGKVQQMELVPHIQFGI